LSADRQQIEEWPEGRSYLTMLIYLNGVEEGVDGGATRLYGANGSHADIIPQQAKALFFRHGFSRNSVLHKGCEVRGSTAKYVVRANIMFE
jgi:hypothetical protein